MSAYSAPGHDEMQTLSSTVGKTVAEAYFSSDSQYVRLEFTDGTQVTFEALPTDPDDHDAMIMVKGY